MAIYSGSPIPLVNVPVIPGNVYNILPGINEQGILLVNGLQTQTLFNGIGVQVIAQNGLLIFQYPNILGIVAHYTGSFYNIPGGLLTPSTTYNAAFGINEVSLTNTGVSATPPSLSSTGSFTTDFFIPHASFNTGTPNSLVTGAIYHTSTNLPFTASVTQPGVSETFQQPTPITIYTGKLGGVDYRFGSDFTLVNADPIVTAFQASNPGGTLSIPLPFTFPTNSSPQPN